MSALYFSVHHNSILLLLSTGEGVCYLACPWAPSQKHCCKLCQMRILKLGSISSRESSLSPHVAQHLYAFLPTQRCKADMYTLLSCPSHRESYGLALPVPGPPRDMVLLFFSAGDLWECGISPGSWVQLAHSPGSNHR